MSSFDPQQFLEAALDKPLVKRPPLAVGTPYAAVIQALKVRSGTSTGKDGQPRDWTAFDIPLEIEVPADQQGTVGQPKVTLTDSVFIDVTPSGGLDMAPGRNRGLRRYYDATGLNKPGTTPNHLAGQLIKATVKHEVAKDGSGDLYERIDGIQKG